MAVVHMTDENNYLFGEGGAGMFQRRQTNLPHRRKQTWTGCCGVSWTVAADRHLCTNTVRTWAATSFRLICRNYRRRIEALGGEYRFGCRLAGLQISDGRLQGLETSSGFVATSQCILAMGHSARDTYRMLLDAGLPLRAK